MVMDFSNVLRGRIAERILVTLLERGGYRVTRLGIEELFDEVKYLPQSEYLALHLPVELRTLPDLLVADAKVSWAKLVEVKFRRAFTKEVAEELHATLSEQRRYWKDSYAVIMIGEAFDKTHRFHQDYVRVIPPGETDKVLPSRFEHLVQPPFQVISEDEQKRMRMVWEQLPTLYALIPSPKSPSTDEQALAQEVWTNADRIAAALRRLGQM
jgi:hypothetical protein